MVGRGHEGGRSGPASYCPHVGTILSVTDSATVDAPAAQPGFASTVTVDGRITAPVLVDATWLMRHRDTVIVLDTRAREEFDEGHVSGARSLSLDALLIDDTSAEQLQRLALLTRSALAARGVSPNNHVVLIDGCDGTASLGAILCELAGVRRVSVVSGNGVDDWRSLGGALVTQDTSIDAVDEDSWRDVATRAAGVATFDELVHAVVNASATVLDVRSQLEHEGIVGSPCCASRGAIPGSVHLEWTRCFDMLGAPLDATTLSKLLDDVGIGSDAPVIVVCHAGHRAAVTARVLRGAGIRNVRVSLGSWHEWSARFHEDVTDEDGV